MTDKEMKEIRDDAFARGQAWLDGKEERDKRERLRDTFAAAALTGLLSRPQWWPDDCVSEAYRIADAMLRERETYRAGQSGDSAANCTERERVSEWDQWQAVIDRLKDFGCWETAADVWLRRDEFLKRTTNHDASPEAIVAKPDSCAAESAIPDCGTGDIPDSRTRLSEAEIDALEYVVEEGRIASMDDYGILRSLLVRVRPEWEAK